MNFTFKLAEAREFWKDDDEEDTEDKAWKIILTPLNFICLLLMINEKMFGAGKN